MSKLFGTDGIRGEANRILTPELALRVGRASRVVTDNGATVVIGRDTRRSGGMIQSALASGMASVGLDVIDLSVIPSPAIPRMSKYYDADLGSVVSASHNPPEDNGIKFFNREGMKLGREEEQRIEERLEGGCESSACPSKSVGQIELASDAQELYMDLIQQRMVNKTQPFRGIRLAMDCANGATYQVAPTLMERLGAEVDTINTSPDGDNINVRCGSTNLGPLKEKIEEQSYDLGVAFDGDGDRALFVDEEGKEVDGDQIIFVFARWLQGKGELDPPLVVSTVASNLGLERSLTGEGIELRRTSVGDRNVAREMIETDALVGGEQSGHIILRRFASTGDGLITAIKMVQVLSESGKALSELTSGFTRYPQRQVNVQTENKEEFALEGPVFEAVREWENKLGPEGRVLIRPSGTQPVVRVMVEGMEDELTERAVQEISRAVDSYLNS